MRQKAFALKQSIPDVLQNNDPLFGVLSEEKFGLDKETGRRKINPEVLQNMKEYLIAAERGERRVREVRVRLSVMVADNWWGELCSWFTVRLSFPSVGDGISTLSTAEPTPLEAWRLFRFRCFRQGPNFLFFQYGLILFCWLTSEAWSLVKLFRSRMHRFGVDVLVRALNSYLLVTSTCFY